MEYEKLKQNFKDFNLKIEEIRKEMQQKSTGLVEEAVNQFLDACPEVFGVHWTQYTPYFNDGESCEFSVNDICFHLNDPDDDENFEPYGSSMIYTESDLVRAEDDLKQAVKYTENPQAWRKNYKQEYRKKYGRDYPSYYTNNLKPYPSDPKQAQRRIDEIKEGMKTISSERAKVIHSEFEKFKDVLTLVPDDIMEIIYGDHAIVKINRNGTEIDEYMHG